jgi:hypothetical protein
MARKDIKKDESQVKKKENNTNIRKENKEKGEKENGKKENVNEEQALYFSRSVYGWHHLFFYFGFQPIER